MDINSLRSMCCKECNFLCIPPDPNETNAIASCFDAIYSSDIKNNYLFFK